MAPSDEHHIMRMLQCAGKAAIDSCVRCSSALTHLQPTQCMGSSHDRGYVCSFWAIQVQTSKG